MSNVTKFIFAPSHLRRFTPVIRRPSASRREASTLVSPQFTNVPVRFALTLLFAAALLQMPVVAQNAPGISAPAAGCPVRFLKFNPWGVSVRVKNVSGKPIAGLTFNAAIADATEHWTWLHWDFDVNRPIRDFGWNRVIKPDSSKTLSWDLANLDFHHGGGGAFVLTGVLYTDGTTWDEAPEGATCKFVWSNSHKKFFIKPVQLPFRQ